MLFLCLPSEAGKPDRLFKALSADSDVELEFIDVSYVKTHQHSTGMASKQEQAIALSRSGNTSKIYLAVNSYSLSIEFIITGVDVHDSKVVNKLIELLPQSNFIVADKGYDTNYSKKAKTKDWQCRYRLVLIQI